MATKGKPPLGTTFNRGSPRFADLLAGYLFNEGGGGTYNDFTGGGDPIIAEATAPAWGGRTDGTTGKAQLSLLFNNATNTTGIQASCKNGPALSNQPFTIISGGVLLGASGNTGGSFVCLGSVGANDKSIHLRYHSATALTFGMYNDDIAAVTVPNLQTPHVIAASLDAAKNQRLYYFPCGGQRGQVSSRTATAMFSGNRVLSLAYLPWQASSNNNVGIEFLYVFNDALAPDLIADIAARPFDDFRAGPSVASVLANRRARFGEWPGPDVRPADLLPV